MNVQEREQLTRFLQQLAETRASAKDAEADALIRETCDRQADAAYLLVQRALLLEQALQSTQREVLRLQQELDAAKGGRSNSGFLDNNAWGNAPTQPRPAPPAAQAPAPAATPVAATQAATPGGWGSGVLGSIATTAAGVVAGSFLFQGIEHLMGNHAAGSGFLSGNLPASANTSGENVVINNYYDAPATDTDSALNTSMDSGVDTAFDPSFTDAVDGDSWT